MTYSAVRTIMVSAQYSRPIAMADCEVAFDHLTRQLYATDSTHYQIEPAAVAFPGSAAQAGAVIRAAAQDGVSVIPRGAGTEECRPCYWMNDAFRNQRAEILAQGQGRPARPHSHRRHLKREE